MYDLAESVALAPDIPVIVSACDHRMQKLSNPTSFPWININSFKIREKCYLDSMDGLLLESTGSAEGTDDNDLCQSCITK